MVLSKEKAIRVELRDVGTQKNGRYRRRKNFYIFRCMSCTEEMAVLATDLKRASGRCRKCAAVNAAPIHSHRVRKKPYEALFNRFNYDRQRCVQESDLTFEDFLEFIKIGECHYCGEKVTWAEYCLQKNGYRYNLDRKDNAIGYLKSNLVVCCWNCNETKSDRFTYDQFVQIGALIRSWRQ